MKNVIWQKLKWAYQESDFKDVVDEKDSEEGHIFDESAKQKFSGSESCILGEGVTQELNNADRSWQHQPDIMQ